MWILVSQTFILLLTAVLAVMAYQSNQLLKVYRPTHNMVLAVPEMLMKLGVVGLALFLVWLSGLPRQQFGLVYPVWWRDVGLAIVVGTLMQITLNLVAHGAVKLWGTRVYSPWLITNILPRRPIEWLFVPLMMFPAVLAVLMEEAIFRSLLLGAFVEGYDRASVIAVTSVIFGLMHQPQGVLGMVAAALLNVVLCNLFFWTGTLWFPLVAHYTINILQIATAHFQRDWLNSLDDVT